MSAEKKFADDFLSAINKYRANHQVKPLTYNREIEAVARKWVDYLARENALGHNPDADYKGTTLGENVAYQGKDVITGPEIAEQWYSEVKDYDFRANRGRGNAVTGHFTQVVWKDSKELGIARAQTKDGAWMIVANFFPPGNFNDDYSNNVFAPKDGKLPPQTNKDERQPTNKDERQPTNKDERQPTKKDERQHTDSQRQARIVSTSTETATSTINGVTTTTITETTTDENGVEKVKVTKKVTS